MRFFFSEYQPNYKKYHFPYQIWLKKEPRDDVAEIYDRGFLPMRNLLGIYYLSRSVRVDLSKFSPSSENRRILRKTENLRFESMALAYPDSNQKLHIASPSVYELCKRYLESRFGNQYVSPDGLKSIFGGKIFNRVFVWKDGQKDVGYAVCYLSKDLLHYAHAFYEPEYAGKSLGARMMLQAVKIAKETGLKYAYLGTCYNQSAFYKLEFSGVEFFNGFGWSKNIEELKWLVDRRSEEYLLRDKDYLTKFGPLRKIVHSRSGIAPS